MASTLPRKRGRRGRPRRWAAARLRASTAWIIPDRRPDGEIGSGSFWVAGDGRSSGHIEVDGAYFGGTIRQGNRKADRIDRRLAIYQTGRRRRVVALRERGGRVLPFVAAAEDEAVPIVRRVVATGSVACADEAPGWDALHEYHRDRQ